MNASKFDINFFFLHLWNILHLRNSDIFCWWLIHNKIGTLWKIQQEKLIQATREEFTLHAYTSVTINLYLLHQRNKESI